MPARKCIFGCKNGESIHGFPSGAEERDSWISFVRKHLPNFATPKSRHGICGLHFASDCYLPMAADSSVNVAASVGFAFQRLHKLKQGSVPTMVQVDESPINIHTDIPALLSPSAALQRDIHVCILLLNYLYRKIPYSFIIHLCVPTTFKTLEKNNVTTISSDFVIQ